MALKAGGTTGRGGLLWYHPARTKCAPAAEAAGAHRDGTDPEGGAG